MVIEAGVSESLSKLRNEANWWFNQSNGLVRIVLVISINSTQRKITTQRWQWQLLPPTFEKT